MNCFIKVNDMYPTGAPVPYERIRNIQDKFEAILDTFPAELQPSIIRSYEPDDYKSPGLLSLAALPYWVGARLGLSEQISEQMAVGNLFLLHCFQSFDFIVDDDRPGTCTRSQIVLGNLCYIQVLNHYRPFFPDSSPFWERMEAYWREWGNSVLWEVEKDETRRPFEQDFLERSAHKAAALKICPTGLALLANRSDLIPSFEKAIDLMHATMQLVDDLKDWREDLQHQRYNSFLGSMVSNGYIQSDLEQEPGKIAAAIFDTDILDRFQEMIDDFSMRAGAITSGLHIDPWTELIQAVAEDARVLIDIHKQRMVIYLMNQLSPGMFNESFETQSGSQLD
jgi:hypothetical protein